MIKEVKKSFNIGFEHKGTESYLVLICDLAQEIRQHQIEMIKYNNLPGVLEIEKSMRDNKLRLSYNVTSKLKMSEYLQEYEVTSDILTMMFNAVNSILSKCGSYLLRPSGFLLHEDYIFIDPRTGEIAMVYIPIPVEGDVAQTTSKLFERLKKNLKALPMPYTQDSTAPAGKVSKPYKLVASAGEDKITAHEIKLFPSKFKKGGLYIYLCCQILFASVFALALPRLKLAVGNIIAYAGMIFIIAAINVFIIKQTFSHLPKNHIDSLIKRKEELTHRD